MITDSEYLSGLISEPYVRSSFAPDLFCEIRCIRGKSIVRKWFPIDRAGCMSASRLCTRMSEHSNAYVGVLPRKGQNGTAGGVVTAGWLWCDVDAGYGSEKDVVDLVKQSCLPKPQITVMSGSGGLHLYWKLTELVPLPDDAARVAFKSVLRRVCHHIGGSLPGPHADLSSAEAAHLLRVPNTLNHKHSPPRSVRAFWTEADPKSLLWWRANLVPEPIPPSNKLTTRPNQSPDLTRRYEGLWRWASVPFPEGQRHKNLVGAAVWLVRELNLPKDIALEILTRKAEASTGSHQIKHDEVIRMVQWV
jgi:hypothetical protein